MIRTAGLTAAMFALAGCWGGSVTVNKARYDSLIDQAAKGEQEIQKLQAARSALEAQVARHREQIQTLQALGPGRLENLFRVTAVELGQYTGGVSTDSRDGDDAVKVYLQPIDQDGNIIKAAGDVTVQLYDLAEPPGQSLVGESRWPASRIGPHWSPGLLSSHFAFTCPWKSKPRHAEITVRVVFVEVLTGKTFTAQTVCKVRP